MVSGVTCPGAEVFSSQKFTDDDVRGFRTEAAPAWPLAERMNSYE